MIKLSGRDTTLLCLLAQKIIQEKVTDLAIERFFRKLKKTGKPSRSALFVAQNMINLRNGQESYGDSRYRHVAKIFVKNAIVLRKWARMLRESLERRGKI
jgi:hypothetical protein